MSGGQDGVWADRTGSGGQDKGCLILNVRRDESVLHGGQVGQLQTQTAQRSDGAVVGEGIDHSRNKESGAGQDKRRGPGCDTERGKERVAHSAPTRGAEARQPAKDGPNGCGGGGTICLEGGEQRAEYGGNKGGKRPGEMEAEEEEEKGLRAPGERRVDAGGTRHI